MLVPPYHNIGAPLWRGDHVEVRQLADDFAHLSIRAKRGWIRTWWQG